VSDETIHDLARRAGIAVDWTNAAGEPQRVAPDVLRRMLGALELPCGTPAQLAASRDRLAATIGENTLPPLITAEAGEPIVLASCAPARARLVLEDGGAQDIALAPRADGRCALGAISQPGYHQLQFGEQTITLAVAPKKCFTVEDAAPDSRLWGLAVQLYGLRRRSDGAIGDTSCICALASGAAQHGADAIVLSPVHALFSADQSRYEPYSPSSRLFLNPLHADPSVLFGADHVAAAIDATGLSAKWARLEAADLIDWPAAAANKLALLRRLFDEFSAGLEHDRGGTLARDFARFRQGGGDLLEQHARFEVLHAARLATDRDAWSWRKWPAQWQDHSGAAVADFAAAHAREIAFHVFLQWVADRSLAAAQAHARCAGMRIGLIVDLAVGMDSGGSHAWSCQHDLLVGLNVGAPPDLFNPLGQSWGLTAFSPRALVARCFEPFLATLRAGMHNAGGVRIDHVMGLTRLWLMPDGASPADGAYLVYPFDDLLRLIKLESHRHRAIVIGEDLGTVPEGFREKLDAAGIAGMRVLWFERDGDGFVPPGAWPRRAVAMTSTHDLPTVAGWWRGVDIDARTRLGLFGPETDAQTLRHQREIDRELLWGAFRAAGTAPDAADVPNDPAPAVDAAVRFIAETPSQLVLVPLEDALGLEEQPNLPGTLDQYPNWRRRYALAADEIFDDPVVRARARWLSRRSAS
jgi:4-alpha-glucanotransferase